ncbi:AAA-domain-containing protein, partial [Linderina pennispora]
MNLAELGVERCRKAGYLGAVGTPTADATSFEDVGGLEEHVRGLKEMVMLPLVYPDLCETLGIRAPRGVLFHGPPGTGKTLLARALASGKAGGPPIAFFMRRGGDVLSKWVGEGERTLRKLFAQARAFQPSIIFFDELDGLAPVRSARQDQAHASIVTTLLALMDGIEDRGQVVVIGATNRPDAIDPALRRPGRFDREMLFRLPGLTARHRIL